MRARPRRPGCFGWHSPHARARRRPRGPPSLAARPSRPPGYPAPLHRARRTSLLLERLVVVDLSEDLLDPLTRHDPGIDLEDEARHLPDSQLPTEYAAEMRCGCV